MTRKIMIGIAAMAIAAVAAWNVNFGSQAKAMSDLSLSNVEALAGVEIIIPAICMQAWDFCEYDDGEYWCLEFPFKDIL